MSGKSTFLRSCALIPILAQAGMFVPATQAHIGLIDKIFARIGAQDNISKNQSTFMVEMQETAKFLFQATNKSLVLVDELGRGTSPSEGFVIAQAVLEQLANIIKCRTLFSTHFLSLPPLFEKSDSIHLYTTSVDIQQPDNQITFTYKIKQGIATSSYALNAAQLAGIPKDVLARAEYLYSKRILNPE
jgi:DNA mismatch repair protein MutS